MAPARSTLWSVIIALLLLAGGATAPRWADSAVARRLFVSDRLAEVSAAEPEAVDLSRRYLTERHFGLVLDLRVLLLCLGGGLLLAELCRRLPATRAAAALPLAGPLLGALLVGGLELGNQVRLVVRAARDGLFTASREEVREKFFGAAVAAARLIEERIPAGDRILLIDFADPGDVQNVSYLVFPRRTFALPNPSLRLDAETFRATLQREPRALDWCSREGFTFAVDLRLLMLGRPDDAIIPFPSTVEDG